MSKIYDDLDMMKVFFSIQINHYTYHYKFIIRDPRHIKELMTCMVQTI